MNVGKWMVLALSILVLSGVTLWMTTDNERPSKASTSHSVKTRPTPTAHEGQNSKLEIQALEAALNQVSRQVADNARTTKALEAAMTNHEETSEPEQPAEDASARDVNEPPSLTEMAEAHHASEGVDSVWSQPSRQALQEMVSSQDFIAEEIDCRTTSCRMIIALDDTDVARQAVQAIRPPWNGEAFGYFDDSVPPRAIILVSRQGHELALGQ